jgi:PAS domain-containing protein
MTFECIQAVRVSRCARRPHGSMQRVHMPVDADRLPVNPWERLQTLLRKGPAASDLAGTDHKSLIAILQENDRLFHAMVDAFEGMIYICAMDYRIEFLNEPMIAHLGHDATESCVTGPSAVKRSAPGASITASPGETVRWEVISPLDNRWYYVVNAPLRHIDGTISKYAMMMDIHDRKMNEEELRNHRGRLEERITARTAELTYANDQLRLEIEERKQAEQAMRRSEAKYRELVHNANSIIIRFDTRGRIKFFNEYAQQFFGYTEAGIVGRPGWRRFCRRSTARAGNTAAWSRIFAACPENSKPMNWKISGATASGSGWPGPTGRS